MSNKSLSIIQEKTACSSGISMNVHDPKDHRYDGSFGGRAAIITLGCAKNQVDSEIMLGVLRNRGYEIVSDVKNADLAIVNTCGFLESSVKESIDAILDVAELKKSAHLRRLIVSGCMVERYRDDLKQTLPEVDAFILTSDLLKVGDAIEGDVHSVLSEAGRPYFLYDETMPRHLSTMSHTAYVKISEGCNRPCTFCIIPKIRGTMRSRSVESIVKEVQSLGELGVKEINLVAQDLTNYGVDTKGPRLPELLRKLDKTGAVDWIRLLYAYPVGTDEELLQTILDLPSVVKYIDIPLQHSSEEVLKKMKRPIGRYSPRSIVELIRTKAPEINIRTTFIVGFPGETEADIEDLVSFVSEGHFSSVGVFTYSREKEAESYDHEGHISEKEKIKRRDRVMAAQQRTAFESLHNYIDQTLHVLVEGAHEDTDMLLVGRASFQAPEVDGTVIINDAEVSLEEIATGALVEVKITDTAGYDLIGTAVRVLKP